MKANRAQIDKALKAPAETRFFLFHGPDDSGSRALAKALGAAMGAEAERIDLAGAELKADPARLADEAASISMFGGARWILVEPAGDEMRAGARGLARRAGGGQSGGGARRRAEAGLEAAQAGAGRADALGFRQLRARRARRRPAGRSTWRGRSAWSCRRDVARRIAEACGGNRAIIEQELDQVRALRRRRAGRAQADRP